MTAESSGARGADGAWASTLRGKDEVDELAVHSPDLTTWKVELIAELFPAVVTERMNDDGTPARVIDLNRLREELAGHAIEGRQERYQLEWPGKREASLAANAPIAKTLRPVREESVDFDTTRNLFIEGDNLDALKLLQGSYAGKVGLIYIDPPYNTRNEFVHHDDFTETNREYRSRSGPADDEENWLGPNAESDGRCHSAWLSMMYPRLELARNLLAENGVMLVSIDANEVAQLKLLLVEIFGPRNFVATIVWVSNLKGRQIRQGGPAGTHEYILCCARNASAIGRFRGSASAFRQLMPTVYRGARYAVKHDAKGPYITKNELHNTNSKFNERTAATMVFQIHFNPETQEVRVTDIDDATRYPGFVVAMPHRNARPGLRWHAWRWSRAKVLADWEDLEFDVSADGLRIRTKIRDIDGTTMKDLVIGPSTVTGHADLEALGMERLFENAKPVALLQTLVAVATSSDAVVLDFFAGSGTTAHAVMKQNATDGGRRRFILVQHSEAPSSRSEAAKAGFPTIASLARERVRRAGRLILDDAVLIDDAVDAGFRALEVDATSTTGDRTSDDLLFQVLLECGMELTVPIAVEMVEGREVFVADDGALAACFDDDLDPALARTVAERRPRRAVFRGSAFPTDSDRARAEQVFEHVSPTTDVLVV